MAKRLSSWRFQSEEVVIWQGCLEAVAGYCVVRSTGNKQGDELESCWRQTYWVQTYQAQQRWWPVVLVFMLQNAEPCPGFRCCVLEKYQKWLSSFNLELLGNVPWKEMEKMLGKKFLERKSSVPHILNLISVRPTCNCPQVAQEKVQG